jgi:segregation and condensation protein B
MPTDTDVANSAVAESPAAPSAEVAEAPAAVQAQEQERGLVLPPGMDLESLAEQIEAIVVTSGRPVPVKRLGQALGLIAADEAAPGGKGEMATADAEAADGSAEPAVVVKPKRSRKKTAGVVEPEKIIAAAVLSLNKVYRESGRTFSIELLAGGYRLMTMARWRGVIASFHGLSAQQRMSKASVETMAIIAYKQPITRAKLEAIRGVACGEVLRSLIERRLVTIVGRAEELGRPMLYGTTKAFLEAFGLASLKDLPSAAEMAVLKRQG